MSVQRSQGYRYSTGVLQQVMGRGKGDDTPVTRHDVLRIAKMRDNGDRYLNARELHGAAAELQAARATGATSIAALLNASVTEFPRLLAAKLAQAMAGWDFKPGQYGDMTVHAIGADDLPAAARRDYDAIERDPDMFNTADPGNPPIARIDFGTTALFAVVSPTHDSFFISIFAADGTRVAKGDGWPLSLAVP